MKIRSDNGPAWLEKRLPQMMIVLFALQPLLDVLSYWLGESGAGNTLSLALRFGVLLAVALAGYTLSAHRRVYWIAAAVLVLFAAAHAAAVLQADARMLPGAGEVSGWRALAADLANYVRVIQLPVFTLCFITFLRRGEKTYAAMQKGFVLALGLVAAVELLSVLTGTNAYTYANKSLGILGWFATTNAQSAILSMVVPVVVMNAMQKETKQIFGQLAVCAVGFGVLFFFGTRLAYLAIFATAVGLAFTLVVTDRRRRGAIALLLACAAVCGALLPVSPMYENQTRVAQNAVLKQRQIDEFVAADEAFARRQGLEGLQLERARLVGAYDFYLSGLVEKYGIARVAERYGYSTDAADLTDVRRAKRNFCAMMMEDAPPLAGLFGLELGDMTYGGVNYDLENDLHGIYMLYGLAGFALMAAFLLYFLGLIAWALARNAKKYYTLAAGGYGIALVMALLHAYATAGLLRRPNASFYFAAVLAVIFYLVRLRRYENDDTSHPAGERPAPRMQEIRKDA